MGPLTKESILAVRSLLKLSGVTVPFRGMKEFVPGKNPMSVNSVGSPSFTPTYLKCTKGTILERGLISVRYVVRLFRVPLSCKGIRELIWEKNPFSVSSALSPLDVSVIFKSTKGLTLEKNPTNVHSVAKL